MVTETCHDWTQQKLRFRLLNIATSPFLLPNSCFSSLIFFAWDHNDKCHLNQITLSKSLNISQIAILKFNSIQFILKSYPKSLFKKKKHVQIQGAWHIPNLNGFPFFRGFLNLRHEGPISPWCDGGYTPGTSTTCRAPHTVQVVGHVQGEVVHHNMVNLIAMVLGCPRMLVTG